MIYYEWLYIYIKNEIKVFALQAPELIIAYKFYNTYLKQTFRLIRKAPWSSDGFLTKWRCLMSDKNVRISDGFALLLEC